MLVEVAERLGSPLEQWSARPWMFTLWTYAQLQGLDRRRRWEQRAERLSLARLVGLAFNEPEKLEAERTDLLNEARANPETPADVEQRMISDAQKMLERFQQSGVMDHAPIRVSDRPPLRVS